MDDSHLNDLHPDLRHKLLDMREQPKPKLGYSSLMTIGVGVALLLLAIAGLF